jgi:hypothetical protein
MAEVRSAEEKPVENCEHSEQTKFKVALNVTCVVRCVVRVRDYWRFVSESCIT